MQTHNKLDGRLLREMVFSAASLLEQNRGALDALNVFPVPDGDTGTNMGLTMVSAVRELQALESDDVAVVAEAFARGALKGARGNSGVILSQLIRGLARGAKDHTQLSGAEFVQALKLGVETAYKAVMKPTEGTILTVARVAVEKTLVEAKRTPDLQSCMAALIRHGEATLQQTPDMLPVLKQAGVVDAGGAGLMCIYRGFNQAITGEVKDWDMSFAAPDPAKISAVAAFEGDINFTYCTEFFITHIKNSVTETQLDRFRDLLVKVGDSAVVVGDLALVKVHVHSNDPGVILQEAMKMGELSSIKIDNMKEQHRSLNDIPAAMVSPQPVVEEKEMGMAAVVTGAGISSIFADLAVDQLVQGGQSMNPSIEDIQFAIAAVPAPQVFVFPNNSNIIMAAQQAAGISDKQVAVIPTTSIPQGLTAALAFRPDKPFEDNVTRMNEAINEVKSGQITTAVRDSQIDDQDIHQGDILGMFDKQIAVVGRDVDAVAVALLEQMVDDDSSLITVLYGHEVEPDAADALTTKLQELFDAVDVETHDGGQPLYDYIFSVE